MSERCECRALMHKDTPCHNTAVETVMRPVRVSFMFWTWHSYKRVRVCDWCDLTGDVRVEP